MVELDALVEAAWVTTALVAAVLPVDETLVVVAATKAQDASMVVMTINVATFNQGWRKNSPRE